jgi:hypothetical protein
MAQSRPMRLFAGLGLLALTACRPTLDEPSRQALARLGAPDVVTRAGLDSVAGPSPDVTQWSDGRQQRRYDWGGPDTVVVELNRRWVVGARVAGSRLP